jgi:hypothetical protein
MSSEAQTGREPHGRAPGSLAAPRQPAGRSERSALFTDVESSEDAVGKVFHPHSISVTSPSRGFRGVMTWLGLGPLVMGELDYNVGLDLDCPRINGYHLNMPVRGALRSRADGNDAYITPGRAVVYRRGIAASVQTVSDSTFFMFALKIDGNALENALAALLGREAGEGVAFGPEMDLAAGLYIDGDWVPPTSGATITVVSPNTGEPIGSMPEAQEADTDAAVDAARRASDDRTGWAHTSPQDRAQVLHRFADAIEARKDEFARRVSAQNGMPIAVASQLEAVYPATLLRYYADLAAGQGDDIRDGMFGGRIEVCREPAGVVAAIVPWNFPQTLTSFKVAPALAAGCTIAVKPSPETVLDAFLLAEAAIEAGLPPGVLNIVPAGRQIGAYLVAHRGVDKVGFTGSTAAGPLQGTDNTLARQGRDRRHQATSSIRVNSSGAPNSAIRPERASRRSATAASAVSPSPLAPTPGRSWACAHHTPSSSCSTVYGTCTARTMAADSFEMTLTIVASSRIEKDSTRGSRSGP